MMAEAEREVGAFVAVVREIFGAAAAARAGEDWVELAETVNLSPAEGTHTWRKLTIMASCRLAANSIFGSEFTQNQLAECGEASRFRKELLRSKSGIPTSY